MKSVAAVVTVLALSAPAAAADLASMPAKALAAPAPFYSWTGCFIGVQGGYGAQALRQQDPTGARFARIGASIPAGGSSGLIGGQLGCDRQVASDWVLGAAVEWSAANFRTSSRGLIGDPMFSGKIGALSSRTSSLGSVTGRFGYAGDHWLAYARAGAGFAEQRYSIAFSPIAGPVDYTGSAMHVGWTLGAGVEWAICDAWTLGVEYDHYGFPNKTLTLTDPVQGGTPIAVRDDVDVVKASLNYRFRLF